jgi:hypothetical protein
MIRKNKKFIDPRYFMDEKTDKPEIIKEEISSFTPDTFETRQEKATANRRLRNRRDFAMEPHAARGESDSAENAAASKCWHETKHVPEEGFAAAFNKCMQKALSTELE